MATIHAAPIECAVCLEVPSNPRMVNPEYPEFMICAECSKDEIVPMIIKAKAQEFFYPPSFGDLFVIEVSNFIDLLPDGFLESYREKQIEYDTPVNSRIFCLQQRAKGSIVKEQCGIFLGVKAESRLEKPYKCPECYPSSGKVSCSTCKEVYAEREAHDCTEEGSAEVIAEGLLICPGEGCERVIDLYSGCNAVRCPNPCFTEACAQCGMAAAHDSDHWTAGTPCPRFGSKTDEGAIFDPPAQLQEEEEEQELEQLQEQLQEREQQLQIEIRQMEMQHRRRVELLAIPLPRVPFLQRELARWQERGWARALVLDETHVTGVLRDAFGIIEGARRLDVEIDRGVVLKMLLEQMRDAYPEIAIWNGIGFRLDQEQSERLRARYQIMCDSLIALHHGIEERRWREYPRVAGAFRRMLDNLGQLIEDITAIGNQQELVRQEENGAMVFDFGLNDIPDVHALLPNVRTEARRLAAQAMINGGGPYNPEREFFANMEATLTVIGMFPHEVEERWSLMSIFLARDDALDVLHDRHRALAGVTAEQGQLIDAYDQIARRFEALFTDRMRLHHRRGWTPNGVRPEV
ncbi:hypothetical protein Q7P37_004321 [Cladosporium fusiforme]